MNGPALCAFRKAVRNLWRTVLRRRGQGNHLPWRRMNRFIALWFPSARVCHPYPRVRLGLLTPGGSRMRNVAKSRMWPSGFKRLALNTSALNFAT